MPQEQTRKRERQNEVTLWVNEITENVWFALHTKYTRIVVQIQQITSLNIILREHKSTIKIPLSELDDVIIENEQSLGRSTHARFSRGRYFTPNYGSGDYNHKSVGDLVFLHHGERKIAFHNLVDPRSIRDLVNSERKNLQLIHNLKSNRSIASTTKMSALEPVFLIYNHRSFKIDRPSNWIIFTNRKVSKEKSFVVFKKPPLDSIEAVSVDIEQNNRKITMEDLAKLDQRLLKRDVLNFQLVEKTNTLDLAGMSAFKIVYDGIIHNRLVRHMRISTIKKPNLYRLVFICEEEKFLERLPTATRMVDSFNFVTDAPKNDRGEINSLE